MRNVLVKILILIGLAIPSSLQGQQNSVLSEGKWYKFSVSETGMHALTGSDVQNIGIDLNSIKPDKIRVFHNGGGLVPQIVNDKRINDLQEIPVLVKDGGDGHFDQNDKIIFYAQNATSWSLDEEKTFYYQNHNPYSDYSYVFVNFDGETQGKRITTKESKPITSNYETQYLARQVIDKDVYNLNNMGSHWYFDLFDATLSRDYSFNFSNVVTEKDAKLQVVTAMRNIGGTSYFYINAQNQRVGSLMNYATTDQYTHHKIKDSQILKFKPLTDNIKINLTFSRVSSTDCGWVDFILMNAWCDLTFNGGQKLFRNPLWDNVTKNYDICLQNASSQTSVWNVSDPVNPIAIQGENVGKLLIFSTKGDKNNEFVAFDGTNYHSLTFVENVKNQNLHAKTDIDYLIISHNKFLDYAYELKDIHNAIDDLSIAVVTPEEIYNEFSCGAADISGIRDYIRYLYNEGGQRLKYVLLFGDASFDMRNKLGENCFIPTYESRSTGSLMSIVTDDFFGCIREFEGDMENSSSYPIVAIGRFPVSTQAQARTTLDKIYKYLEQSKSAMSSWRNRFTFITDDNNTSYMTYTEELIDTLHRRAPEVIVDKIYLDAYEQKATSGGQRAPEVNEAINKSVARGALVVNYVGHGGEVGWAAERILTNDDITSWTNSPMLPFFITATCEFSRFDDHSRVSAGELTFLNAHGGAIAMLTTARVTLGGDNQTLQRRVYNDFFDPETQGGRTFGELFLLAKKDRLVNTRVWTLFGDPALRLAYPQNKIVLKAIDEHPVETEMDTLRALQTVLLSGEVQDPKGSTLNDFSGVVSVKVYDKETSFTTKGDETDPMTFKIRNSVVFNGKADVLNGRFSTFITLPRDIAFNYGRGLISFYGTDFNTDANGAFEDFIIGGYDGSLEPTTEGPEVKIFLDDSLFVDGKTTSENPLFIAYLRDDDGINTSTAYIGHEIKITLSGATTKSYTVNDFYEAPLDAEDFGTIKYPLEGLNEGEHTLTFRVWDVFNNSTVKTLTFNVVKSKTLYVDNIECSPNPVQMGTYFSFDFNQKDSETKVQIDIYDIFGRCVRTIKEQRFGTTGRENPIYWDGCGNGGSLLNNGLYVYQITISNDRGEKASGFSKLVISH